LFPKGTKLFPLGWKLFPQGTKLFPEGRNLLPSGTNLLSKGPRLFPIGRTSITLTVVKFTTAETPGAVVSAHNILKNVSAKESNILQKRGAKNG